jgi:hypothetical protein
VTFDPTPAAGAQPLEPTSGVLVYMRDIVEALSQRWNRYVVNYDLHTQVRMLETASRKYDAFRSRTGLSTGWTEKLTRAPTVAAAVLVLGIVAYVAWKQRRRRDKPKGTKGPRGNEADPTLEAAAALYRALETALAARGIRRLASTPPLRHALSLRETKHPLADEVWDLTNIYLEARFGGIEIDDDVTKDFTRRVKALRRMDARAPSAEVVR